jgi:hypothetical protein
MELCLILGEDMRIVRMYSGVLANSQDWKKVEIEVDENDLTSILYEAGIDPFSNRAKVATRFAFQLLTLEAELLMNTTMVQSFDVDVNNAKAKIEELKSRKFSVLEQLRVEVSGDTNEG